MAVPIGHTGEKGATMLLIRFMGAKELLDHRHNRNPICNTEWMLTDVASTNKGWCFFPVETVSQRLDPSEIHDFMLKLSLDIGHTYDYYMVVEGEEPNIHHAIGYYNFAEDCIREYGCKDFSKLRIIKTGICR